MQKAVIRAVLLTLFCILAPSLRAQEKADSVLQEIRLMDGNVFRGYVIEQNPQQVVIQTESAGQITVQLGQIKEIRLIGPEGFDHIANPQSTRYFFSPNGYGLRKGEGYYQNVWVLFNQFSIGVNDYLHLGGGLMPLFLFAGAPTPIWITPKVSIPIKEDQFNVGLGGLFGTVLGEDPVAFGLMYGHTTFGSRDANLSFGFGWGFADGEFGQNGVFSLSGYKKASENWYLMSENYFLIVENDLNTLLLMGARRITRNTGIDLGLLVPIIPGLAEFIALPWLGVTIPFGG